jgi:Ca2+-binding EF-hand superfamily protein
MKRFLSLFSGKKEEKKNVAKNNQKNPQRNQQKAVQKNSQKKTGSKKVNLKAKAKTGVRRTKSTESTFSISNIQTQESSFGSRLSAQFGPPQGQTVFDCCAYVIHCPKHSMIACSKEEKVKAVWLPFVPLPPIRTWIDGSTDGANIILSKGDASVYSRLKSKPPFSEAQCMQVLRIQLPQTQKFITRLIYYIKLDPNNNEFKCCEDTKRLFWLPLDRVIAANVEDLWGPELSEFARLISGPIVQNMIEYSLDQAFFYVPRDPPRNLEEEMLKSANITEKDVERLYGDFVEHSFPSHFLTKDSFKDYMSKYGFEKNDSRLQLLFNALNYLGTGFLSFHELLIGLASMEPNTKHAEARNKLVFRFFDADRDGLLNESEFKKLVKEIYPKDDENTVQKKVKEGMKAIGVKKGGVDYQDFSTAVGQLKFRGTSQLCRSSKPIFSQISRSMATRTLKRTTAKTSLNSIIADRKYTGICKSCKEKKYDYAIHTVKMDLNGYCSDPKILTERKSCYCLRFCCIFSIIIFLIGFLIS